MAFGKKQSPLAPLDALSPEEIQELVEALDDRGALPLHVDVDPRLMTEFKDGVEALDKAVKHSADVPEVLDETTKGRAADSLKELRDASKEQESTRKQITKRFDDAKKRVKAAFDESRSLPDAAIDSLSDRIIAQQDREDAAEEERRKAELAKAQAAQEEENRRAAIERRQSHHVPAPAPRKQPTGARGSSGAKASPTSQLGYEIVDAGLIPDDYKVWELNRAKILADVRQGIVIPGVEPKRTKTVRVG